ncbi:MAG: general stress protein [Acidimicrobiales bacterium]
MIQLNPNDAPSNGTPESTPGLGPAPTPEVAEPGTPTKIAEYPRYVDAQRAVDTLSDEGFPVSQVSIVWAGLRHIEYVTGRETIASAALRGAAVGAWFGFFLGLLFAGLGDTAETTIFGAIAAYALTGAFVVGVYRAVGHWARRGTRDFATTGVMDAERYEVWVDPDLAPRATQLLRAEQIML